MKKIFSILLTISLTCTIWSCGARKVNKTEISKTETTEQTSVVKENLTTETNVKKEISIIEKETDTAAVEIVTVTPIDPTKPAYFFDENGVKKELSNTVYRKEKVFKTSSKNRLKVSVLDESLSKKTDKTIKTNSLTKNDFKQLDKQTERLSFSIWWWLVPAGFMVLACLGYLKYKNSCVGFV